jgi:TnpA family transposase
VGHQPGRIGGDQVAGVEQEIVEDPRGGSVRGEVAAYIVGCGGPVPETLAAANAPLVTRQADLPLAQAWGGGMVAAVDGMRFVVPVPAAFARPNRKFFGSKRGMTWLNAVNDRGMGRGAKIVSGTVRDSLHMVDVIFGLDGGELPEIVVSDTASYSDVVFGLLELLDISYRPALADLPDQKGWRIRADADYGPLNTFARGKIDLAKIRRNWEDILRVVASIYTGAVRAYDVVTMLQRDGHPTALGEAIAMYGRIFKSLHILAYIDTDESYRRDIKGIRNLQEGRHALARKICHGRKGELYHRYERGLENQLGALGLVLNCVTLWTTVYLDAAVRQLRAQGYPVLEEDMARLSPFVNRHLGARHLQLRASQPGPRSHPRAARPGRRRRGRRVSAQRAVSRPPSAWPPQLPSHRGRAACAARSPGRGAGLSSCRWR